MLARWTGLNKREKSVLKKKLGRYYSFYQNLYIIQLNYSSLGLLL